MRDAHSLIDQHVARCRTLLAPLARCPLLALPLRTHIIMKLKKMTLMKRLASPSVLLPRRVNVVAAMNAPNTDCMQHASMIVHRQAFTQYLLH